MRMGVDDFGVDEFLLAHGHGDSFPWMSANANVLTMSGWSN
jgi:hypothetical protein